MPARPNPVRADLRLQPQFESHLIIVDPALAAAVNIEIALGMNEPTRCEGQRNCCGSPSTIVTALKLSAALWALAHHAEADREALAAFAGKYQGH